MPTVVIQPNGINGKDASLLEDLPNNNFGNDEFLRLYSSVYWRALSLLQFDLSGIQGEVTSAKLYAQYYGDSESSYWTIQIGAYEVLAPWNENTVTYDNKPLISNTYSGITTITQTITGAQYFWDITQLVKDWVSGNKPNNGLALMRQGGDTNYSYSLYSSDTNYAELRPKLEITYNAIPSKPTITAPNGGETLDKTQTITWTPATDIETAQASLKYQIQLSSNNGVSWKDIVSLTGAGVTSVSYDFTNETETSTAKLRIRAYDGATYGLWDETDGVFTISHNVAPTAPTNLNPTSISINRGVGQRLSWHHNDPNGTDPQSKFDLQWRMQGNPTWITVTQTTTNNYYDIAANTFPAGAVEWRVRTYDQAGLVGPYSTVTVFTSADMPGLPTITSPINNGIVAVSKPVIQWSAPVQTDYHVRVLDQTDTVILWEDIKASSNKAVTVGVDLVNQTIYKIQVAVKSNGLWSDFAEITVTISYTSPPTPYLTTEKDDERGAITLNINNLLPTGTEPDIGYNDVYRRENAGEWVRIAKDLQPKSKNGQNLIPPFHAWSKHVHATIKDLYWLELISTAAWEETSINIKCLPNSDYTFNATDNFLVQFLDNNETWVGSTNGGNFVTNITFTTPADAAFIKIIATSNAAGTYQFRQPMLTAGTIAKPFDENYLQATFIDYESKPNATIEYYVSVYGSNETVKNSGIISNITNVSYTQVAMITDSSKYATLQKGTQLSERNKIESAKMNFAGREYAVTEFGSGKEKDFDYKYIVTSWNDFEMIQLLASCGETLLLRDSKGRKEYVTIDEVTASEFATHWEISIKPMRVYYVEGV